MVFLALLLTYACPNGPSILKGLSLTHSCPGAWGSRWDSSRFLLFPTLGAMWAYAALLAPCLGLLASEWWSSQDQIFQGLLGYQSCRCSQVRTLRLDIASFLSATSSTCEAHRGRGNII